MANGANAFPWEIKISDANIDLSTTTNRLKIFLMKNHKITRFFIYLIFINKPALSFGSDFLVNYLRSYDELQTRRLTADFSFRT